jgi:hypothetical protein
MFGLTKEEFSVFKKLSTPSKIQDFLDTLPFNFEKEGETNMSPRRVLREKKAHCMEGALLAAAALWIRGERPLLLDLKAHHSDMDHVVALYKKNGSWGAISKTNHACLRFRDPIHKTVRELAVSYFHEYFLNDTGVKTLREYSKPFDLKKQGIWWLTSEDDLWNLAADLDESRHDRFFPKENQSFIRKADQMEKKAGALTEWEK